MIEQILIFCPATNGPGSAQRLFPNGLQTIIQTLSEDLVASQGGGHDAKVAGRFR